jgi:molecular chaperone GrpE
VEAIREQIRRTLKDLGAEPVPGVGTPFDPRIHEAVGTVAASAQPPDTIVEEVRRGYLLDGEVLRPAQVLVARSPTGGGHREPVQLHGGKREQSEA